jgi:hypothetical protein
MGFHFFLSSNPEKSEVYVQGYPIYVSWEYSWDNLMDES